MFFPQTNCYQCSLSAGGLGREPLCGAVGLLEQAPKQGLLVPPTCEPSCRSKSTRGVPREGCMFLVQSCETHGSNSLSGLPQALLELRGRWDLMRFLCGRDELIYSLPSARQGLASSTIQSAGSAQAFPMSDRMLKSVEIDWFLSFTRYVAACSADIPCTCHVQDWQAVYVSAMQERSRRAFAPLVRHQDDARLYSTSRLRQEIERLGVMAALKQNSAGKRSVESSKATFAFPSPCMKDLPSCRCFKAALHVSFAVMWTAIVLELAFVEGAAPNVDELILWRLMGAKACHLSFSGHLMLGKIISS